jgi:hypothetical protein
VIAFKNILKESMSFEQEDECFPPGFDPTKRDGGVGFDDDWNHPGNPDDYHSALWDFIKNHWYPHQSFDELNDGPEKIAKAVSNAWWAGWYAALKSSRKEDEK